MMHYTKYLNKLKKLFYHKSGVFFIVDYKNNIFFYRFSFKLHKP